MTRFAPAIDRGSRRMPKVCDWIIRSVRGTQKVGGKIVPLHSDTGNPVSRSKIVRSGSLTDGEQAK